MIKHDKQLKITQEWIQQFRDTIDMAETETEPVNPLSKAVYLRGVHSKLEDMEKEVREYEDLKSGITYALHIDGFSKIYEALIKARIAKGWSQAVLADKIGVKEQQIQRYEATDYSTASLPRMDDILYNMGVEMNIRVMLKKPELKVPDDYNVDIIKNAQDRMNNGKKLLQTIY